MPMFISIRWYEFQVMTNWRFIVHNKNVITVYALILRF